MFLSSFKQKELWIFNEITFFSVFRYLFSESNQIYANISYDRFEVEIFFDEMLNLLIVVYNSWGYNTCSVCKIKKTVKIGDNMVSFINRQFQYFEDVLYNLTPSQSFFFIIRTH